MDRRKFIGGVATNLIAVPLAAWSATAPKSRPGARAAALLSTLVAGTVQDLGPYANASVAGGNNITDYSGITYDAAAKRMLLFGGGHGIANETDIRAFDLSTLAWSSLYPSMPYSDMTLANCDSDRGRWVSTNHPFARHSYNATLVAARRFYMMCFQGMPYINGIAEPQWGGRICWYDLDAGTWTYSQIPRAQTPWQFTSAAALDPASGKILVVGPDISYQSSIWLYDPATDTISAGPKWTPSAGGSLDLVYVPDNDRFYAISQIDAKVWELTVNRSNFNLSTATLLAVSANLPSYTGSPPSGYAYDPVNKIIGGFVTNGIFSAFDPLAKNWTQVRMVDAATGSAATHVQSFYCLDFDTDSGCFIFLGNAGSLKARTFAYRYSATTPTIAIPVGIDDLGVTLDFGGGSVATFSGATAVDKGDFIGEFVRQKCYLATNPSFPDWRVFFRVDADASGQRVTGAAYRDEMIVEYGRATQGAPAHWLTPYSATITKGGTTLATYTVPKHWWYGRWRYQSSQRPVVRTPATLKARGWLPNFGASGLFGLTAYANAIGWGGPMSAPRDPVLGAFSPAMAATGDNAQIGFLTEYAADYVINGSPASLATARTEGEWCGNWSMHIRDDASGAVADVRNKKLRFKSDGGTVNGAPAVNAATYPDYVVLDSAHFYPCSNLPWLLTEDPFFLEEMQFGCNWRILFNAYHRTNQGLEGLIYPGQTRSLAWGLRDLFQLAASCPAAVPQWLRPKSYWQSCIDDHRVFALRYVQSPARIQSMFRVWTRSDLDGAWQSAWLDAAIGMAVDQGFTAWKQVFDWGIDTHIQRTNGTSGWNRQWPVPYYAMANKAGYGSPQLYYSDKSPDATTCTSWADFWSYYASGSDGHTDTNGHLIDTTGWDGHTLMQQFYHTSASFILHLRAVLAVAITRGTPGAEACYDYIQTELANSVIPHYKTRGQARFSIDPGKGTGAGAARVNYEGLWWNTPGGSESGWGINLAHQGAIIFATWFTYDAAGRAWWLSMAASETAENTYTGTLYETRGPAFDANPFDPELVIPNAVGSGTLTFSDPTNGTFAYTVNSDFQMKPITQEVFASPTPTCSFDSTDPALASNYQDIWWAYPPGSESGWGINVTHQGDIIFATWFTYDFDGAPLWLSATAGKLADGVYAGTLYQTTGPAFNAVPFDPTLVSAKPVGLARFTFTDGKNGYFDYTFGGVSQVKPITRFVFQAPATFCA